MDFEYQDRGFTEEISNQIMICAPDHNGLILELKNILSKNFKILSSSKVNTDNTLNLVELDVELDGKRKCKLSYYMKRGPILLDTYPLIALEPQMVDLGVLVYMQYISKLPKQQNSSIESVIKYPFFYDLHDKMLCF